MEKQPGVTAALRRLWFAGSALVALAVVLPGPLSIAACVGGPILAVACGMTAARGPAVRTGLRVMAGVIAVGPAAVIAVVVTVLWFMGGDPLAIFLIAVLGGGLAVVFLMVFCFAYIVETLRLGRAARRRFVAAGPAWKNDPTPPSFS